MKKSELVFTALLVPLDYFLVFVAALTARDLRFKTLIGLRPVVYEIPFEQYLAFSLAVAGVFVLCFALAGLYAVSGPRRIKSEVSRIFLASSTAIMAVIVLIFIRGELFSSRFIVLAAWVLALSFVAIGRVSVRIFQRLLIRAGIGIRKVALVGGDDRTTSLLMSEFSKNPAMGYQVVKRLTSFDAQARQDLDKLVTARSLDEIIVADPASDRATLEGLLGFAESRHVTFRYSADLLATHAKNIEIGAIAGVPIVEVKGTRLDGWGRIFKRAFDLAASSTLIVLTSPIMLAAAIAIKLDSRGPVLFTTLDDGTPVSRVGEHGRKFRYFKFRSMTPGTHNQRYGELAHLDTRKDGPLVKIKDDPRVTRVGRFIRKYSIDELPELFLVFAGKMSLVGPRPHLPEEVAKYDDRQRRVLTVKPGITGMAQVSGRADLAFDEEVRLDIFYIENWSPWLDLAILFRTPIVVLARKGAS
ncbi:MAG TPA: sugar transferase [Candidatus Binatia bacterium]|jgi:exopolysaccharide biosynthesis polyprenyl glycosylphosphotransferase|nr:sugar transferase [Candidatus Binatia bacterium]